MTDLRSKQTKYCSFCGKSQYEVSCMIAGPTVFICEECVHLCLGIIAEKQLPVSGPLTPEQENVKLRLTIRALRALITSDFAKQHARIAELGAFEAAIKHELAWLTEKPEVTTTSDEATSSSAEP